MFDGLLSGSLVGAPQEKTGASGRPFVQCRVRVPTSDGDAVFALVTAFDAEVRRALVALTAGDPVSLAGAIKIGIWTPTEGEPRASLTMTASACITPYHIRRKRDAVQRSRETAQRQDQRSAMIDDDLAGAF